MRTVYTYILFLCLTGLFAWGVWSFTPEFEQAEGQGKIHPCSLAGGPCQTRQVGLKVLWKRLQQGQNEPAQNRKLWLEFYLKMALPLATFFTTLLVAPLGLVLAKHGSSLAVAASIGLVFIWYLLFGVFQNLAEAGTVSPFVGAWVQNLAFAGVGLGIFAYLNR